AQGDASSVVSKYLLRESVYVPIQRYEHIDNAPGNDAIRIRGVELLVDGDLVDGTITKGNNIRIEFSFWNLSKETIPLAATMALMDFMGECVFFINSAIVDCRSGLVS